MADPTDVLGTVGRCIYCGSQEALQQEHIVPFGLNGHWVLNDASCPECAKITGRFELDVLRNLYGEARIALNLRTRRRQKRRNLFPLRIVRNGVVETIQVPINEYLPFMALPKFKAPASLDQRAYDKGIDIEGAFYIQVGGLPYPQLLELYQTNSISIQVTYEPVAFARMLAKIAYGFAVGMFGLDMISQNYVLPSILGTTEDVGRWVGMLQDNGPDPATTDLHQIWVSAYDDLIVVHIRLFAECNPPTYIVVVGRLSGNSSYLNTRLAETS